MLGALYVYFTRIAQRDELALGLPVLNRANAQFKQTAGLFVEISPAWFQFGQHLNFSELLVKIRQLLKSHYRYQRFPISELNREVGLNKTGRSPLFDISLSYHKFNYDTEFDGIKTCCIWLRQAWEQTPLVIYVYDFHVQTHVKLDFVYNLAYFTPVEIQALQSRLMTIVQAVLAEPATSIRRLPILTEQEIYQLKTWNQTQTDYPQDQTIVTLFEQQVTRTPDNIAVVFEDEQLTYHQLNEKANQFAHELLSHPVLQDAYNPLIAICVERSLDMLIGLLGILKAGGAYVPIDPKYPAERITHMLNDSTAPLLLTQSGLKTQLPVTQTPIICLDETDFTARSSQNTEPPSQPHDLAYVIYTSGSTGTPKGVMVEHHALILHIHAMQHTYAVQAPDRVLQFASMDFDTSLEQILVTWLSGAGLIPVKNNVISAHDLLNLMQSQKISIADLPPAYWQQMLDINTTQATLPDLHTLILGGEALPWGLAQHTCDSFPNLNCFNAYGPTEAVITPTLYRFPTTLTDRHAYVLIGQPRANTQTFMLDDYQQLQPIGIPGDLYIAGDGLARGYLNRPELTKERFIEINLLGTTQRLYRTGDLVRWLPDGNLEFLSRLDDQIKLRGFRIELGEIEGVLTQHEYVKEVVVTLYKGGSNKTLAAYVTMNNKKSIVENNQLSIELRDYLKTRLPDYMLPTSFTVLDKLPLTANGKVDRQALPEPSIKYHNQFEAPRNEIESQLVTIWQNRLNRDEISIHDNRVVSRNLKCYFAKRRI
ncbi:MAG: amino acid adenylation domain-containing protein [Thioploca sp.]|nr:amino acid adenylation domain-containing protein [Thioploca sp.]